MSLGDRGKALERSVKKLFKHYENMGLHCQINQPERLHDGTIIDKHGFDFQVLYNDVFYAFDAKECQSKHWNLSNAKPHQTKALLDVTQHGGKGFYLVYFTPFKKLVIFYAPVIQHAFMIKRKSLQPADGKETGLDFLGILKK